MIRNFVRSSALYNGVRKPIVFIRSLQGAPELVKRTSSVMDSVRLYPKWAACFGDDISPLALGLPWITFSAISYLESNLKSSDLVFEYGSGGSTTFFSKYCKFVESVDHDQEWETLVQKYLVENGISNVSLRFIPGTPTSEPMGDTSDSDCYRSLTYGTRYADLTFENYVKSIDQFPDDHFDVVLVDGRARPACFRRSERHVKPGGMIILDNSDRKTYTRIQDEAVSRGWRALHLSGPTVCNRVLTTTSIFLKPDPGI